MKTLKTEISIKNYSLNSSNQTIEEKNTIEKSLSKTYAIVEINGHQFWLEEKKYITIQSLKEAVSSSLLFKHILLIRQNNTIKIGFPYVDNVHIEAEIINHLRGSKIIVYKMKSKKGYRRKKGHRQQLTKLFIKKIEILN
jgi:large subunit ribosomal protein L21